MVHARIGARLCDFDALADDAIVGGIMKLPAVGAGSVGWSALTPPPGGHNPEWAAPWCQGHRSSRHRDRRSRHRRPPPHSGHADARLRVDGEPRAVVVCAISRSSDTPELAADLFCAASV
jgi:hypothetical protein